MALVQDAYLESTVLCADPVSLVRMLFQAALDSAEQARRCLRQSDILGRTKEVNRVLAILTELSVSLKHDVDPKLGRTLAELYDYMQRRLIEAHIQQADPPLAEVARLLSVLHDAWSNCRPAPPQAPQIQMPLPEPEPELEYAAHSWSF